MRKKILHAIGGFLIYGAILYIYSKTPLGAISSFGRTPSQDQMANQTGQFIGDAIISVIIFLLLRIVYSKWMRKHKNLDQHP